MYLLFRSSMLIGVLLFSTSAFAITNIENHGTDAKAQGWHGKVIFSLDGKSGNSKEEDYKADGSIRHRKAANTWLLIGSREYGKSFDQKDTDKSFAHLRFMHEISKRTTVESYLQHQTDDFKLLESRALIGGGMRFNLTPDHPRIGLAIGVGAYYTEEKFDLDSYRIEEDYARASTYFVYQHQLSKTSTISNTLYVQPRFSRPSDVYALNDLSLELKMNSTVSFQLTLKTEYDSDPVADVKKTDQSYHTSVVFSF